VVRFANRRSLRDSHLCSGVRRQSGDAYQPPGAQAGGKNDRQRLCLQPDNSGHRHHVSVRYQVVPDGVWISEVEEWRSEDARVSTYRQRRVGVVGHLRFGVRPRHHHRRTVRQDRPPDRTQEPLPSLDDRHRCCIAVGDWASHVVHTFADDGQVHRRLVQNTGGHDSAF